MIVVKLRLVKKNFIILRLELVVVYMVVNLVDNVRIVFEGYLIIFVYGWSDSIVVFYWIKGGGFYK